MANALVHPIMVLFCGGGLWWEGSIKRGTAVNGPMGSAKVNAGNKIGLNISFTGSSSDNVPQAFC